MVFHYDMSYLVWGLSLNSGQHTKVTYLVIKRQWEFHIGKKLDPNCIIYFTFFIRKKSEELQGSENGIFLLWSYAIGEILLNYFILDWISDEYSDDPWMV